MRRVRILLLSVLFFSCVGTIEDNNSPVNTSKIVVDDPQIEFKGIETATAISHDKVEVTFKAATGGSQNFSYLVYVNSDYETPKASSSGSDLEKNSLGDYLLQVKELNKGETYRFSVRSYDETAQVFDKNTEGINVTMPAEELPNFDGVQSVENVDGINGQTQLKVTWFEATPGKVETNYFGTSPYKVSGYSIYMGESENSLSFYKTISGSTTTSTYLTGLKPTTKYYVKVRAKDSRTPPKEEENNIIKTGTTTSPSNISFYGVESLSLPISSEGFSKMTINWGKGSGDFDRYKIFTSTAPLSSFNPETDTPTINNIEITTNQYELSGLNPHTTYYVAVVACLADSCAKYKGHQVVKSLATTPAVAPFNGVKTISSPGGTDGLTQAILSWDAPDTTLGHYNVIKIFKSTPQGLYNEADDLLQNCSGGTNICTQNISSTSILVKNLTTNQQTCFVAKAYSTSPAHPNYPNGLTHTNSSFKCTTPTYETPGFLGLNIGCNNQTYNSFRFTWTHPTNPVGIYETYEIYYKKGVGDFAFDINSAIQGNYSDIQSNGAKCDPATGYCRIYNDKTTNYLYLTGLLADSSYKIAARTYYNNGTTVFRDPNQVVINCSTLAPKMKHQGWYHVMSLGPKVNGILTSKPIIPEKILLWTDPYLPEDDPTEPYPHLIPVEDPTGDLGINASKDGMVMLMWDDFVLSGTSSNLYDLFLAGGDVEYRVFRMEYDPAIHDANPPLSTNLQWGAPINTSTIRPQKKSSMPDGSNLYYGVFVDYTLDHPLNNGGDASEGNIFWYMVKAYMDGKAVEFENENKDVIIKVILPPANMALGHRWIMNREMCGILQKEIDRNNNYRCLYDGLGSTNGYLDYGQHKIVDRFGTGLQIRRGDDKPCRLTAAGIAAGPWTDNDWLGQSTGGGRIAGDCIIATNGTGLAWGTHFEGSDDAVLWSHDTRGTAIYRCAAGTTCSTTVNLDSLSNYLTESLQTNAFKDLNDCSGNPICKGYHKYFSNNAYLPNNLLMHFIESGFVCSAKKYKLNNDSYYAHPIRRKEDIALTAWWPMMDALTIQQMQQGILLHNAEASGTPATGTMYDTDCLSMHKGKTLPATFELPGQDKRTMPTRGMKQRKWNPPATEDTRYFLTGSAGRISTEACVSRYGVQDPVGNAESSFLADMAYRNTWGWSSGYTDLAGTTPIVNPLYPDQSGDWTTGSGQIYEVKGSGSMGGTPSLVGAYAFSNPTPPVSGDGYFNPVMGVIIANGEGVDDDNELSHMKLSDKPMGGLNFYDTAGSETMQERATTFKAATASTNSLQKSFATPSYRWMGYFNGRFTLSGTGNSTDVDKLPTPRCVFDVPPINDY